MAIIVKGDEVRRFNPVTIRLENKQDYDELLEALKEVKQYSNYDVDDIIEGLENSQIGE